MQQIICVLLVLSGGSLFQSIRHSILGHQLHHSSAQIGRKAHIYWFRHHVLDGSCNGHSLKWSDRVEIWRWLEELKGAESVSCHWFYGRYGVLAINIIRQFLHRLDIYVVARLFWGNDSSGYNPSSSIKCWTRNETSGKLDCLSVLQHCRIFACTYSLWDGQYYDWWRWI